jgi:hypothetical protein
MWTQLGYIAAFVGMLTLSAPSIGAAAHSSQSKSDTYTWSGEFVSVDTTAKSMTVKSRVAYQEAVSELKQFKPGEQVWIVWSGVRDYSDAVRQVRRSSPAHRIDEDLVLPAELVSPEATNQYIAIRVKVPESSLAALKAIKPGEWVTVVSRHRPSTETDAVVVVKPYGSNTNTD